MTVRVKLKMKGIRGVMLSNGVRAELARTAKQMAERAGEGFEYVVKPHKRTARAFVQTDADNPKGRERQAREHVLERLL